MMKKDKRYFSLIILLCAILLCVVILSFYMGRFSKIAPYKIPLILWDQIFPIQNPSWTTIEEGVVLSLRLPRILGAVMVGASLAVSGVAFQMLFANPVASPDTLGVTSSASCGAVLAIILGMGSLAIKVLSFGTGCLAVLFVLFFATRLSKGRNMTIYLILIGMVVSAMFSAMMSIMKFIADPTTQLPQITYWLMGSFSNVRMKDIPYGIVFFALGMVPLLMLRWRMNLLSLSEYEARSMGENVSALRITTIVCATLLTASSVAMTGGISWVGLVVPHIARLLVGNDARKLLPVSALMGSAFLLLMDDLARSLTAAEIPISILTSLVGAPIFFVMLFRNKDRFANEN